MLDREAAELSDWGDEFFEPTPVVREVNVTGRVFLDRDKDGVFGQGDRPLPGVWVCDEAYLVRTDERGTFSFSLQVEEHRTVWIRQPSGFAPTTSWYQLIRQDDEQTSYHFSFGLTPSDASEEDFTFVVGADSQFSHEAEGLRLKEDMTEIAAMVEAPRFFIHCGDLVMTGWLREWKWYMQALEPLEIPVYHAVGGHEENYGMKTSIQRPSDHHFRLFLGPTYYSWDFAGVHFVVYDNHRSGSSEATKERQEEWLKRELESLPAGTDVIFVSHYPLNLEEWMAKCTVHANFYGHWHQNMSHRYKEVSYLQTAALRGGDFGMFSRAVRICRFERRQLTTEIRVLGQHKRLGLISVIPEGKRRDGRRFSVMAYDTICPPRQVAVVTGDGEEMNFKRAGAWTWQGTLTSPKSGYERGSRSLYSHQDAKPITLKATNQRGECWSQTEPLQSNDAPLSEVVVESDWSWFGRDSFPGRWVEHSLRPPLHCVWQVNTGSRNQLATSPILLNGKLYYGTYQCDRNTISPVLLCLAARTGRTLWKYPLDGDVPYSPAALVPKLQPGNDGIVFVTTNQGTTYAIDASTGEKIWSQNPWGEFGTWAGHKCSAPPIPYEGHIIVSFANGPVVMYEGKSGKIVFSRKKPKGQEYVTAPCAHNSMLFWSCRTMTVAEDLLSDDIHWVQEHPDLASRRVLMGVVRDEVFYRNTLSATMAFECATGKMLWVQRHEKVGRGIGGIPSVVVGPETLISGTVGRICFSRITGEQIWDFETVLPQEQNSCNLRHTLGGNSTPAVAFDVVYFGGEDGYLYALDARDGHCLWRYDIGLPIQSSPIFSGNTLFVTDYDGNLYAFAGDTDL
ncbi:MAG: PQQ-binding-like beta-propeller repeat protein [bacterium]|nr:PQQ-binding-like beta-propeller repeat protein [bacterium]